MSELKLKHWQDAVNALLGIGVFFSPWVLGYQDMTTVMVNSVIVGVALVAAALGAMLMPRAWEEWTEGALGLWLAVSPWTLGFAAHREAMQAAVVMGLAVLALSIWTLAIDKDLQTPWRDSAAH